MSALKAVLFDAGNTLFFERPSRFRIYAEAARARGLDVTDEAMAQLMHQAHATLPQVIDGNFRYSEGWFATYIEAVFGSLGFAGDWQDLSRDLFGAFEHRDTFHLYPETRAVIKRLKGARRPIAVVSNWSPRLPRVLGMLGLFGDFDAVLTSAIVRLEKPDAAIFLRAAELLGVSPQECVHIGDHPEKDVIGAQAAGASAVLLDRDGTHSGHPERVTSLEAVLPLVGLT